MLPLIEDNTLLAALVSAKGDTSLAAERLQVKELDLVSRLQLIDFDTLSNSIKNIVAFQMLDTLKYVQLEVISKLDTYSPSVASKLLVDLLDRLQTTATPPTQSSNSPIIIQQLMNQESNHVREELARRIINAQQTTPSESDRGLQVYEQDGN